MSEHARLLVNRYLGGDQSAAAEFVDLYRGQVFGLCYRMLRHRQDAEDVTQESFVRAMRSLRTWDQNRELLPWLLAIAGNRCRTLLAARTRRPSTTPLVDGVHDGPLQDSTQEIGQLRILAEEVELALGALRPQYRQVFLMFHEQGLSYSAISTALGCPVGTVKTWVHRARRELIAQLKQRGAIEESPDAVRRV